MDKEMEKEMNKEMDNRAMVRFNLVGGLVYTLTGDEACKVFKEYAYSTTGVYIFNHDDKMIAINDGYIVSVEWKGVK